MCIRDSYNSVTFVASVTFDTTDPNWTADTLYQFSIESGIQNACLLYTSDAADERSSVDLGGRRIIKKKKNKEEYKGQFVEYIIQGMKRV